MAPDHQPVSSRVLLLDTNLGFQFALAFELEKLGIAALPAHSVREAKVLLAEFGPRLDLVIAKYAIRGTRAFIQVLREYNPDLPVVAILPDTRIPRGPVGPFAGYLRDPEDVQPQVAAKAARLVQSLICRSRRVARTGQGSGRY